MREFMVSFHSFRDIQEFAALCGKQPFRVLIGTDRYQVNASSLLGILSLNCRKPLKVTFQCGDEDFLRFSQAVSRFLANP